ncbi:hypothetical protein ENC_13740 [Enterobacter hormaechei]|nr:hypothetical protein ENC_13740 [Enterobacter hormaechei]
MTLTFEEQAKKHVIMMFLFRAIGLFKATQQFCAERFAIQISPVAKDFNNNLTQCFLLGWKRGFFEILRNRCCRVCEVSVLLHVSLL